jgi:hypothetical protein
MGLTQQRAVVILYGVTALFGALSLLTMTGQSHAIGLAAVVFTLVTWIGIRQLGYSELGEIRRWLLRGLTLDRRSDRSPLDSLRDGLRSARDAAELQRVLADAVSRLGFERAEIRLRVPGPALPAWEAQEATRDPRRSWAWTIPLVSGTQLLGEVELQASLGRMGAGPKASEIVDVLAVDLALALARLLSAAEKPGVPAGALVAGVDPNPSA